MPKVVLAAKDRRDSVIGHPQFAGWVRQFDCNNPKFLRKLAKRLKASRAHMAELERKARQIDRETNWRIPVRVRV